MNRVAKYHFWPPLDLEILLCVLTGNFDFAVRSLSELVDDKVCIVYTEVMEEHWDCETYRALQVTLPVGSADKPARDVVVVTDFEILCPTLYELVTADVAPSGIIIFLLLAGTEALHPPICSKNLHVLCFSHNERVKKRQARSLLLLPRFVGQSYKTSR